jgi:hypothetical protein
MWVGGEKKVVEEEKSEDEFVSCMCSVCVSILRTL